MTWAALISLLLEFFGPLLRDLLDDLFEKSQSSLGTLDEASPVASVHELFTAARAQTWKWQWGVRAKLAVCERIAANRATELVRAARDKLGTPVLSRYELSQIDAVL